MRLVELSTAVDKNSAATVVLTWTGKKGGDLEKRQAVMKCPACFHGTVYRYGKHYECERCGAAGESPETIGKFRETYEPALARS